MDRYRFTSSLLALAAALLFGASAPIAKLLLGRIEPIPLAALLYLGCGLTLLAAMAIHRRRNTPEQREAPLAGRDFAWLGGAILAGGVLAPIILLVSLRATPAATASLLLNFETVATTLLAVWFFGEAVGGRAWSAIGLVTLAAILLSIDVRGGWSLSLGALGILAACILWGLDNNLTRNISAKNPLSIAMLKGLAAGIFSLGLALSLGAELPAPGLIFASLLLGGICYGLSLVLFILAMRGLGTARTSALFGTAPLAGVTLSFLIFGGSPTLAFFLALVLMMIGTGILVREQHGHLHVHEAVVHEHAHSHDDGHHDHDHTGQPAPAHSHLHSHSRVSHHHEHMPDLHHRHTH